MPPRFPVPPYPLPPEVEPGGDGSTLVECPFIISVDVPAAVGSGVDVTFGGVSLPEAEYDVVVTPPPGL